MRPHELWPPCDCPQIGASPPVVFFVFVFFLSSTDIYSLSAITSLFSVTCVWELVSPSMQEIDLRILTSTCM